ncbi:MAG TPA: sigma-70 family RNA polymerase sigma factor [Tepidisphaeraceae bacterium]|nr:sigma-70 family RNA polymerase sigma factor [Tepidisphaeraceae bacterium]
MMGQPEVDALKFGLASGCPRAYATLYDQLAPALLRTARALLGSTSEAEDSVQDVFVSLVRSREHLAKVEDLTAYLFTALRHVVGRRLAQRAAESRGLEQLARKGPGESPAPSCGEDEELERALAKLPDEQRQVIALKIDGGLTFAQIAAVLNISLNTAASRYRYALEKLRQQLGRNEP